MDKHYKVTLHLLYTADVYAENKDDAISYARDGLHDGGIPEETNNEVGEIDETTPND